MHESEVAFINAFIFQDRRERWLTLLPSEKGRAKLVSRLAHTFYEDLDPRFVHDKDAVPADITEQVQKALKQWLKNNPRQLCHIIAYKSEVDGKTMSLAETEEDFRLTFGAIIILISDKLVYYHMEHSNINRQPCYLLFRPSASESD